MRVTEIIGLGVDKMDPDNPQDTPTEVDWAILRLASPVANVTPIPVEPVALADIERRIKAGEDVLSNLGYGTYGITISRRLHRSEGCTLIEDWREMTEGTDDRLVVTTCPVIKGDSGGPILLTDKAQNRRLIAVVSGYLAAAGAAGHRQPRGRRPRFCRKAAIVKARAGSVRRLQIGDTLDRHLDRDIARLLEMENGREAGAFLERGLEAHQHHVGALRREGGVAAGRHLDILHHAHGHHVPGGVREMQLAARGNLGGNTEQTIGFRAMVGDRKIQRASLGAGRRGAGPGMGNDEGAGGDLMGRRARRG